MVIYSRSFVQDINKWRPYFDKIYLYAKDRYKAKHQYLLNKREKLGLHHYDDPESLIEYQNHMQDVYKNTEEYNL